jgi:HD-GYP domain-containing protein (c-di-GMP phosphodiesterase class II)
MERKIKTDILKLGMYVTRLDRPWLETPFLFQGFYANSDKDLSDLRQHCRFVFIDDEKGVKADQYLDEEPDKPALGLDRGILQEQKIIYPTSVDLKIELEAARDGERLLTEHVANIMIDVQNGGKISVSTIKSTVTGMIESILRNPDAYMWLRKLQKADSYLYSHAIDVSVLAVAFGRHLGLDKIELEDLAVGTMLFDIGKMKLPVELLTKPGKLTDAEFALMRRHVEYSVKLMEGTRGISPRSIDIALTHHERHNGKGYPRRLPGAQIPVFGRIAAIVDCYDAIVSKRPYSAPLPPHEAIAKIYEWRNFDFQEDLVEQFIQCLGIYPTGSIVELNTGAVGIVLAQNPVRRLRPKLMVILDENKKPLASFQTIDLFLEQANDTQIEITRALERGAFGIDPKDYFL